MVVTVEDGKIIDREMRTKPGHAQFREGVGAHDQEPGGRHGYGPAADHRHGRMAETIADCEAVLAGGMGTGAYETMRARHIRPVITDISDIDKAVLAYANGDIVDHVEKLH
jgi:predicted Fe-Mo cluster-binding NifX family protein